MKAVYIRAQAQAQVQVLLLLLLASSRGITEAFMPSFTSTITTARVSKSSCLNMSACNEFAHHSKYTTSKILSSQLHTIISTHHHHKKRTHLMMNINGDDDESTTSSRPKSVVPSNESESESENVFDGSTEEKEEIQSNMLKTIQSDDEPTLKEEETNPDKEEVYPAESTDIGGDEDMDIVDKVSMSDLLENTTSTLMSATMTGRLLNDIGSRDGNITKEKRVPITIRYSEEPGLRPYFLTTAKKIKDSNPDVIVEKRTVPTSEENKDEDLIFEVLVDDKVIVGKPRCKWQGVTRTGGSGEKENDNTSNRVFGMSVYINMKDVNEAIAKARRKRRPSTAYAQQGSMMRRRYDSKYYSE